MGRKFQDIQVPGGSNMASDAFDHLAELGFDNARFWTEAQDIRDHQSIVLLRNLRNGRPPVRIEHDVVQPGTAPVPGFDVKPEEPGSNRFLVQLEDLSE